MKKSEFIKALAPLNDDAEVMIGIITPKDEDSFDMGSDPSVEASDTDEDEDGDITVDNGDGSVTNFEEIYSVDITETEDPDTKETESFGVIVVNMMDDDDDEEEDGEDAEGEPDSN